jgi:DNA-binding transcriptional LysR family regulator
VNLSSIDLNLLHALHVVLAERSVARAAARLRITPSAVSSALARARRQFADPLMVRSGRRLVPTARALALQPALAAAIGELETALRQRDRLDPASLTRRWTVGVSDYAEAMLMPPVLAKLARLAPRAAINMIPVQPAFKERALDAGEASLLVGIFTAAPDECKMAELWTETMVCVARHDHPAVKSRLTVGQFVAQPHVAVGLYGGPSAVDNVLGVRQLKRHVACTVATFVGAPLVAASTNCIATVPRRLAERLAAPLKLRIFEPPLPIPGFTIVALWHRRSDDEPTERFLRNLIVEHARPARP